MNIKTDFASKYYTQHLPMTPKYITVHNAATSASARTLHAYNKACIESAPDGIKSWHFSVDEAEVWQALPLNINAWHAGDGNGPGNRQSIGIEITRDMDYDTDLYARAEDLAAHLCAYLLDQFDLPITALKMHQDWSGKYCPHRILERHGWEDFKATVTQYRGIKPSQPDEPPNPDKEEHAKEADPLYRVQMGAFRSPDNAEAYCKRIAQALIAAGIVAQGDKSATPFVVTTYPGGRQ